MARLPPPRVPYCPLQTSTAVMLPLSADPTNQPNLLTATATSHQTPLPLLQTRYFCTINDMQMQHTLTTTRM